MRDSLPHVFLNMWFRLHIFEEFWTKDLDLLLTGKYDQGTINYI